MLTIIQSLPRLRVSALHYTGQRGSGGFGPRNTRNGWTTKYAKMHEIRERRARMPALHRQLLAVLHPPSSTLRPSSLVLHPQSAMRNACAIPVCKLP